MEKNLEIIARTAREKHAENWDFRAFLKQLDWEIHRLDAVVHRIYDEVSARIDCTKCANCCRLVRPVLDEDDISRFAQGLEISPDELRRKYLIRDKEEPDACEFNDLPCSFLSANRCSNYEFHPKACASYPHLHKDGFVFRLWGVIENYSYCPIVFNLDERLKENLWHSYKNRHLKLDL